MSYEASEKWLSVIGHEGTYEVSNFGRVRSLPRKGTKGGLLVPARMQKGHLRVTLTQGSSVSRRYVHALVLEAFIGPCPKGMECCHFPDPNPTNNYLDNLRWDTRAANRADAVRHGMARIPDNRGERHGMTRLKDRDAAEIKRLSLFGMSQRQIAKQFSISKSTVSRIVNGKGWTHIGAEQ